MSKKKKQFIVERETPKLSKNPSIIVQMEDFFKKTGKKKSSIIQFLSMKNLDLMGKVHRAKDEKLENLPTEDKQHIIEFYHYFMEKYDEVTFEERMENWGNEPFILRAGAFLEEQALYQKQKQELTTLNDSLLEEAESLAKKIWNIREDRILTFYLHDAEGNEIWDDLYLQKYIPKEGLDMSYTFLLYDCAAMLLSLGTAILTIHKKDVMQELAVRTNLFHKWEPVPKEELANLNLLCDDGTYLEPEDDLEYMELTRP